MPGQEIIEDGLQAAARQRMRTFKGKLEHLLFFHLLVVKRTGASAMRLKEIGSSSCRIFTRLAEVLGLSAGCLQNRCSNVPGEPMSRTDAVRGSYDRIAASYDRYAALEQEVSSRLLDRITFRRGDPGVVVDLGCGTGGSAAALKKAFRKAQVIGLDLSAGMLGQARRQSRMTRPIRFVNAGMDSLPFAGRSVDLVFSNLAIPWLDNFEALFGEVRRVLKPGGMFLFSMYGAGSLVQLREASAFEPVFPDLLQVGDALTAAGFLEPVMDVDMITMHYPDLAALAEELEKTGTALLVENWTRVQDALDELEACWPAIEGGKRYPLGFEIVYGTAFGPADGQAIRTPHGETATFPVDSLLNS